MSNQLSIDQAFINNLNTIIEDHIEDDQFGVEELAIALGISRSQLHRKLNAINGKSTSQFIREFRLEKAMDMLQDNVATASEIAYKVGFSSPSYFNTSFNQYYGYPPGEVKFRNPLNDEDVVEIPPMNDNAEPVLLKRRRFNPRTYVIASMVLILIAIISYYNFAKPETNTTSEIIDPVISSDNSIAVLPFRNMSGNPDNEAFCDGMTTAVISGLSKIRDIKKVISFTSMMNYRNSNKSIPEISDELKVHYILESGFQKSGNEIKINLQLIDGTSDKLIWSEEYEGKYDSVFKLQARVAEMVAKQLKAKITEEERTGIHKPSTKNMEAYANEVQGFYLLNSYSTKNIIASRKYFEKAIELDSAYADAYTSLGRTYSTLGTWYGNLSRKEADSLAAPYFKKALQLNPKNFQLIYSMAEKELFNWNFKSADSLINIFEQQRGKFFFSSFIDLLLCRNDEVIESTHHLLKENPDASWGYHAVLAAYAYYFKGKKESSLYVMRKGLQLAPDQNYYDHFGNIYLAMGDYEKAKDVLETGLQISDKRHASMVIHLAAVYYYLGDEGKSKELLNEVIDRANKGEPEINVFVAHYYARLGNKDEAFKWLDIAYKKHEVDMIWLKADPNLLKLKNDPRYKLLCQKVGFPETKNNFN
ncbi:TolB-like protein [Gelidibacter algens]|uniref:TolB-like protein n=1 Tax=Gelidibacter algens TaxID=49280 RepID=A0A1A7QU81_9FLAO|nr:helix-turn-helix domain-containing protein [Gelidibacter algens]OBX22878.1 hypothetical protein A9996_16565 [Gelidibacter algens]RAJ27628.1 TolB-like protein [Gelidibacter algens]